MIFIFRSSIYSSVDTFPCKMESASGSHDGLKLAQKSKESTSGSLDLTQFAYSSNASTGLAPSPLRRSPRKSSVRIKSEDSLPSLSNGGGRNLANLKGAKSKTEASKKSPKKVRRGYAAPNTYAHLSGLHDWLKEDLDGIQPVICSPCLLTLPFPSHVLWNQVGI
jgi:hypothetical protein